MSNYPVVGLIGIGEMGAAVGGALTGAGIEVRTVIAGRGPESRARAAESRLTPVASFDELVSGTDLVISVLPPDQAHSTASALAGNLLQTGKQIDFLEANAISPQLVRDIAALFSESGAQFLDGGIIGGPPGKEKRPRLYVSGAGSAHLDRLDGIAFDIRRLPGKVGQASAFKMVYAALTKGTNTLLTNVALCAESFGFLDLMMEELSMSQSDLAVRARSSIPRLPCDAERWVREMQEIRDTFRERNLPGGFHEGAGEIMEILNASRFGSETRRTRDTSRGMTATIRTIIRDRAIGEDTQMQETSRTGASKTEDG